MKQEKLEEIENIFNSCFENSGKPEWDCESSDLSSDDQEWIWNNIPHNENSLNEGKGCVRGNKVSMVTDVSYDKKNGDNGKSTNVVCLDDPHILKSKDDIAYYLAKELDDLDSLSYYENLIRTRRRDFLRNCLVITLSAFKRGQITKTKAAYFTGVTKRKTAQQERIKRYKGKHTT